MNKVNKWTVMMAIITSSAVVVSACKDTKSMDVTDVDMKRICKTLASDEFMGRAPFSKGEELTVTFLKEELEKMGFEPAFGDSYFQEVPMRKITSSVESAVIKCDKESISLQCPDQISLETRIEGDVASVKESDLVFCGFGIFSKSDNWDDFKGADLKGKTMVVLVNDPGLYTGDSTLFRGKEMTYYGRWTYKYEEAYRRGASAVIIVHEPIGAGYGYNVPRKNAITPRFVLADSLAAQYPPITGWISEEMAEILFSKVGYDLKELRASACKADFKPFAMNMKFSAKLNSKSELNSSKNVAGILRGKKSPDESVLIAGHWDHFGIGEPENGDSIYNGAVDNATTVAKAFEVGRMLAKESERPDRSVILFFPTAEEEGLLGSYYYVEHPALPIEKTMACLNSDMMVPKGRMLDFTMVGFGYSGLDELFAEACKEQGRYVNPDPNAESGLFFRGDQFAFFKKGVPATWAMGCFDSREYGKKWAADQWEFYVKHRYHRPSDNYDESWDWSGICEDVVLNYIVAKRLLDASAPKPEIKVVF